MGKAGSHTGRVRARRCAVQALYQWIMAGAPPAVIVREFVAERELIKVDIEYFTELSEEIPAHVDAIKDDILPAIDRQWDQIDTVEQAILLIGAYELKYAQHIPWRVAVNESVELSKMFGAEDSFRYINGVLDKIARRVRPAEVADAQPTLHA